LRRLTALVAASCVVSCSADEASAPPRIALGLEECSYCRMIISEERHAAAIDLGAGETRKFDDIGCLLASMRSLEKVPQRVWVHDVDSVEWLDAATGYFVLDEARTTPMGSGVAALASEEAALERAGALETIYDWDELLASGIALRSPNEENQG